MSMYWTALLTPHTWRNKLKDLIFFSSQKSCTTVLRYSNLVPQRTLLINWCLLALHGTTARPLVYLTLKPKLLYFCTETHLMCRRMTLPYLSLQVNTCYAKHDSCSELKLLLAKGTIHNIRWAQLARNYKSGACGVPALTWQRRFVLQRHLWSRGGTSPSHGSSAFILENRNL